MQDPCLIVSIVRKGWGDTILEATMDAGAHGGTVMFARGIGRNEQLRVFGIQIEPEKEVVLTVISRHLKDEALARIVEAAQLNVPGNGLAFVLPVEQVVGTVHLVQEQSDDASGQE